MDHIRPHDDIKLLLGEDFPKLFQIRRVRNVDRRIVGE